MATEKPRFSITLDEELFNMVEDYRHDNHISTRSKAVVKLVEKGIAVLMSQDPELIQKIKEPPSAAEAAPGEEALLESFRQLNEEGQGKVVDYVDDLVQSAKYIKSSEDPLAKEA